MEAIAQWVANEKARIAEELARIERQKEEELRRLSTAAIMSVCS